MLDKDLLILLSKGYIYVEFIKKDGNLRKMWCTRSNRIVKECGHEMIQFNNSKLKNRERQYPHLLYVYDIQEDDTRILNLKTYKKESVKFYNNLGEVIIPDIEKRFDKLLSNVKTTYDSNNIEFYNEKETGPNLESNLKKIDTEVDDIFS